MICLPKHFSADDRDLLRQAMQGQPFAALVSTADGAACFTHLLLVARQEGAALTLLGHIARANPHGGRLRDGTSVTAIFHGPNGYVSPRLYTTR